MLKRILLSSVLLLASLLMASAADQRVTLTVTITNLPVTSNTLVFTAPAAKTITWTNVAGSASVVTGATVAASTTNLFFQIAANAIGTPRLSVVASSLGTNSFQVLAEVNQNIAVASVGTGGGNWAALTLSTSTVTRLTTVRVPIASEVGDTNRTNVGSLLVAGISDFSTNAIASNSIALRHALQISTNAQTALGPKTFYQFGGTNTLGIFEGMFWNPTNHNPVSSNALFLGNALRSEGVGGVSLQLGSNAQAKALRNIAIGADSFTTNTDAIAIGSSATGTNLEATVIGKGATSTGDYSTAVGTTTVANHSATAMGHNAAASGTNSVSVGGDSFASGRFATAIGYEAGATEIRATALGSGSSASASNSVAVGQDAAASHMNSIAIGKSSTTTTNGQIMLGSSDVSLVQTYGRLQAASLTNNTITGTNTVVGDWAWTPVDVSSLANGNNIAVAGTNTYVYLTGPTAAFAINGITGGRSGREITFLNGAQATLTLANESGVDPTAANRLRNPGYVDVTVQSNGMFCVRYDASISRWRLAWAYPQVAVSTNSLAAGSTREVPYNNGGIFDGASGVLIDGDTNLTVNGRFTNSQSAVFTQVTASRVAVFDANKQLTNSAAVDPTELEYSDGLTNGIQAQINGKHGYTLDFMLSATHSPADSTAYYLGARNYSAAQTTYALTQLQIPKSGTLRALHVFSSFAAGSAETVSAYLRINDTTDIGQTDFGMNSALNATNVMNSGIATAVTAGQTVVAKIMTPAWVTNPTGAGYNVRAYIE